MYKKLLTACCSLVLAAALTGSAAMAEEVTVTGSAPGIEGEPIVVEVVATPEALVSVTVTEQNETPGIGSVACETLPEQMVAAQSLDVDDISGATVSSGAIKQAVSMALESAGIDPAGFTPGEVLTEAAAEPAGDQVIDADVVVVGAGGAGMTAAIEAIDAGLNVVIIESQAMVGGNSVRSTGGLNSAKTPLQDENEFAEEAGVEKQLAAAADNWADNEAITALAETDQEQWAADQEIRKDILIPPNCLNWIP